MAVVPLEARNDITEEERHMLKKPLTLASLVVTAALGVGVQAASANTTPTSPGACHMIEANPNGLLGMDGSQGGKNMVPLFFASLTSGCTP